MQSSGNELRIYEGALKNLFSESIIPPLPYKDKLDLSLVSKKVKEALVDPWRIPKIVYRIFWYNQEEFFLELNKQSEEFAGFFEQNKFYINKYLREHKKLNIYQRNVFTPPNTEHFIEGNKCLILLHQLFLNIPQFDKKTGELKQKREKFCSDDFKNWLRTIFNEAWCDVHEKLREKLKEIGGKLTVDCNQYSICDDFLTNKVCDLQSNIPDLTNENKEEEKAPSLLSFNNNNSNSLWYVDIPNGNLVEEVQTWFCKKKNAINSRIAVSIKFENLNEFYTRWDHDRNPISYVFIKDIVDESDMLSLKEKEEKLIEVLVNFKQKMPTVAFIITEKFFKQICTFENDERINLIVKQYSDQLFVFTQENKILPLQLCYGMYVVALYSFDGIINRNRRICFSWKCFSNFTRVRNHYFDIFLKDYLIDRKRYGEWHYLEYFSYLLCERLISLDDTKKLTFDLIRCCGPLQIPLFLYLFDNKDEDVLSQWIESKESKQSFFYNLFAGPATYEKYFTLDQHSKLIQLFFNKENGLMKNEEENLKEIIHILLTQFSYYKLGGSFGGNFESELVYNVAKNLHQCCDPIMLKDIYKQVLKRENLFQVLSIHSNNSTNTLLERKDMHNWLQFLNEVVQDNEVSNVKDQNTKYFVKAIKDLNQRINYSVDVPKIGTVYPSVRLIKWCVVGTVLYLIMKNRYQIFGKDKINFIECHIISVLGKFLWHMQSVLVSLMFDSPEKEKLRKELEETAKLIW